MITLATIRQKVDRMFCGLEPEDPTYRDLSEIADDLKALDERSEELEQNLRILCTPAPAIGAKP